MINIEKDKLKLFKTIEEAQKFISQQNIVVKAIGYSNGEVLICYYDKEELES